MSGVMRGSGWVRGPLGTCQSFSASTSAPRLLAGRNSPRQLLHCAIRTPSRCSECMSLWHEGHVIVAVSSSVLIRTTVVVLRVLSKGATSCPHTGSMRADEPGSAFLAAPLPLLLAHRGGAAYPPSCGIENTMRAFRTAVELGSTFLETDVHASRDGVAVITHDNRLQRLCGVSGSVADLDWAVLSRLRVGGREPLPRLAELLAELPQARVNIDIKSDDAVLPTLRAVTEAGAQQRVCLATFSDRRMRRIRTLCGPDIATACSRVEVAMLMVGALGELRRRSGAVVAQVPVRTRGIPVLTAGLIRRAHSVGMQVHVWTIDDPETARALLGRGVDGLITDRPDLLLPVVAAASGNAA
jgi:glycerophosphoryl diester phosphodiesterase